MDATIPEPKQQGTMDNKWAIVAVVAAAAVVVGRYVVHTMTNASTGAQRDIICPENSETFHSRLS